MDRENVFIQWDNVMPHPWIKHWPIKSHRMEDPHKYCAIWKKPDGKGHMECDPASQCVSLPEYVNTRRRQNCGSGDGGKGPVDLNVCEYRISLFQGLLCTAESILNAAELYSESFVCHSVNLPSILKTLSKDTKQR